MRAALALARRGLGNAWPNPAVGCVLVAPPEAGGRVVGRGWTQPGGRPHAETEALRRAGAQAPGATAYLSLEPCCHHGETPPCAEALIAAGISRAVIAIEDPDPRVAGAGISDLEAAGIEVVMGICGDEARIVNEGYILRETAKRPLITLKLASSLDGRIATGDGDSRWITHPPARAAAHALRASYDAVVVGSGTALADDPKLTCRLPGLEERSPLRIVFDGRLRLPLDRHLVVEARRFPTWLVTIAGNAAERTRIYRDAGLDFIEAPAVDGSPDLACAVREFANRGLTRVLVEGGGILAASFLRSGLVDRVAWFRAPSMIGGDGVPAAGPLGIERIGDAPRFVRTLLADIEPDVVEHYRRET
jgi:diaminohydroxyphosphoribosylaminopyrimidine deaminase/5-amino-6-(5-phosphoribosylamino)uracil reductase